MCCFTALCQLGTQLLTVEAQIPDVMQQAAKNGLCEFLGWNEKCYISLSSWDRSWEKKQLGWDCQYDLSPQSDKQLEGRICSEFSNLSHLVKSWEIPRSNLPSSPSSKGGLHGGVLGWENRRAACFGEIRATFSHSTHQKKARQTASPSPARSAGQPQVHAMLEVTADTGMLSWLSQ